MKQVAVFLTLFAAAHAFGPWVGGLSAKFGTNMFSIGRDNYIALPRTVTEAKNSRWVETARPETLTVLPSLVLYCPSEDDRVLCLFFDDTENVAGTQIGLPIDALSNAAFDWESQGYTLWTPPITTVGVTRSYWTLQQYFVDEEILALSIEERLEAFNSGKTLQNPHVWVTGPNRERLAVDVDATLVAQSATSGFTQQACVIFMGRHYYYNMTSTTPCTASGLLPWFPLVHSGELIGMGYIAFANIDRTALVTDYFEAPTRSDVEMIVPSGPQCLYELAETPGLFTLHTYFIDAPWLVNCFFQ